MSTACVKELAAFSLQTWFFLNDRENVRIPEPEADNKKCGKRNEEEA